MAYQLNDINFKTVTDPKGFVQESDAAYHEKVNQPLKETKRHETTSFLINDSTVPILSRVPSFPASTRSTDIP